MTSLTRRTFMGGCAAATLLAVTGTTGARAATGTTAPTTASDEAALQAAISDLSHPPATSAQLRVDRRGDQWYGTAGAADLGSGRAVRPDDRFRAGSVTKAFVATVILQLWAERRVELEAPIGRYLPDLLPSAFSRRITVAQLLNHTSGLPDHRGLPDDSTPEGVLRQRWDRWTPREWVETVTHDPLKFAPGTAQEYRGINYVLLALLIEKLTGHPYGHAIGSRVLRPLGLTRTLLPGQDPRLHGPQVRGYLRMTDGSLRDITVYNQSSAWGEGELISTLDDLFRFQQALFSGALLPPDALDKLFTLPPDSVRMLDGTPARYSLGLQKATVNGVTFWGKTGETYGYRTRMFTTRDQSLRFVLSYTPTPLTTQEDMTNRVVAALTA
ncbi:serine hydrolase domain-containing protein [Streptomyces melanosporofaciens]|uniref:serine hydrolase domain-containing protein n=1 Tax=unclassified Streptomyces TaxID=2593676 RepID=UPI0036819439